MSVTKNPANPVHARSRRVKPGEVTKTYMRIAPSRSNPARDPVETRPTNIAAITTRYPACSIRRVERRKKTTASGIVAM